MTWIAGLVIALAGLGMIAMAGAAIFSPGRLRRFLGGFARSAHVHFLELAVRLVVGASFIVFSPHLHLAGIFRLFGWIIVLTSIVMLFIPWRWHQRFAGTVVPVVIRHLPMYALGSFMLGAFILYGILRPLIA